MKLATLKVKNPDLYENLKLGGVPKNKNEKESMGV
jgi:hypothetical protein